MKVSLGGLSPAISPIGVFIRRFRAILFFLLVSAGLFAAILTLLSIIELSSSTATTSDGQINGSFDEMTIQRIKNDTATSAVPGNRQSPFVE